MDFPYFDLTADAVLSPVDAAARALIAAAMAAQRHATPRAIDALDAMHGAVLDAMGELQDAAGRDAEGACERDLDAAWVRRLNGGRGAAA